MASLIGKIFGKSSDADAAAPETASINPVPNVQQCCSNSISPLKQKKFGSNGCGISNKSIAVIPQDGDDTAELAAVIVSIRNGGSYDDLFSRVKQKAAEGTRVACYLVNNYDADELQALVEGQVAEAATEAAARTASETSENIATQMRADIAMVDPSSVVFNWECCGGCSGDSFSGRKAPTTLMSALLAKGYMVMVSDFSLGALIKHWDATTLGANPFKKVGEFTNQLTLRFSPEVLVACDDSAQLQILGELCSSGEAHVHAMSGTKAFTVDQKVTPAAHPQGTQGWTEMEVLTIVTKLGGKDPSAFTRIKDELCTLGDHKGLAGHVVLRYPSGGRLLASCPHWIELSNLDVNAEQLLQVAETRYGMAYASRMRQQMASFGGGAAGKKKRKAYVSSNACMFVQQSAPAKYSKSLSKSKINW